MSIGIRGINPIWFEVDLTGLPFDDNFWLYVLENTIPYIPTPVYHDVDLSIPWTDPIQFLANGTLPVDIFWNPNLVYRLEFRKNNGIDPPSQADALIYEVNDYVPGTGGSTPITAVAFPTGNQITNPQFALTNFVSPLTTTTAGTYEVAPGWFLDLVGTGTATIEQVPFTSISSNPTNAPYALHLVLSGWTADSVVLRQRFQQNGILWSGKVVAASVTARTGSGFQSLTANLVDDLNTPIATVLSIPVINTTFTEYTGHDLVAASTDTTVPPAAYIELQVHLASNNDIYLTSFQLVVEDATTPFEPKYLQDSIERQEDYTFHYYNPKLQFKPIPSMLVGWDFTLNPAQFGNSGNVGAAASYIWDQTIAARGGATNIPFAPNPITGGLQFTTAGTANSFLICQYLFGPEAVNIIGTRLAVNLNAYRGTVGGNITYRIYLFRGSSASVIPTLGNLIGTLSSNGVFTKNATPGQGENWTEIPRSNFGPVIGLLSTVTTDDEIASTDNDYGFHGWEVTNPAQIDDTNKFCIIVSFGFVAAATVVSVESCSLVPGDIPTRPGVQKGDEVQRECQYYYRKSFLPTITPANSIASGASYGIEGLGAAAVSIGPIVRFDNPMIQTPTVTLYNPAANNSEIRNVKTAADWAASLATNVTEQGFTATGTKDAGGSIGDEVAVQWVADARLGQ